MTVDMVLPYTVSDPSTGVSGTARVLFDLAEGFASRGYAPTIWARGEAKSPGYEKTKSYLIERVPTVDVPRFARRIASDRFDAPFVIPLLLRNLRRPKDVLMTFNDPWPCLMRASFKIFSLHIPNPHLTPNSRLIQTVLDADVTICCSRFVADRLERYAPRISRRITYVLNGIDAAPFESADGEAVRRRLRVGGDETVLLYAGQINRLKGLDYLIRALRKVKEGGHEVRLIVIGSSKLWPTYNQSMSNSAQSYEEKLRSEATDLPVDFAGLVPESEKPSFFAAADIFVCPSVWNEPFGLTNLEAMAAGKAVVASRVGGIPEVVKDEKTGILVPPGDVDALSASILRLVKDPDARSKMGREGRAVAKSEFSLGKMVDGYLREIR